MEAAREQIASLIGTSPREIVFTSGATEANNLALFGVADAYAAKGKHIVTQATEHHAILDPCKVLERRGYRVTYLPVDNTGLVDPAAVDAAICDETILVSVMLANNEIGTVQPISEIGAICHKAKVVFHCDAAQGIGKIDFDVEADQVDLASMSAHKLYGPKGVGCLYVRRKEPRVRLTPMMHGGGHERGLRSGTLNVPGIVGFGVAAEIAHKCWGSEAIRLRELRNQLLDRLATTIDGVHLNGHTSQRLPGNLNVSFAGVEGEALLLALQPTVAVSSGSACTSATLEPSHVLEACGVKEELARSSIRFGLGRQNTFEEVEMVASSVIAEVNRLRTLAGSKR